MSWVLFIRSFFFKERPLFILFVSLIYPIFTLIYPTDTLYDPFIQMRFLLAVGIYLIGIDALGNLISINIQKMPYLDAFFANRNKNSLKGLYLSAGWSAIFVGKTAMSSTGRAAIVAALVSGGIFLVNGHMQRTHESAEAACQRAHESAEAARQRAHEITEAARQRAYEDYKHARDQYEKQFFKQGPKPTWSEDNFNKTDKK